MPTKISWLTSVCGVLFLLHHSKRGKPVCNLWVTSVKNRELPSMWSWQDLHTQRLGVLANRSVSNHLNVIKTVCLVWNQMLLHSSFLLCNKKQEEFDHQDQSVVLPCSAINTWSAGIYVFNRGNLSDCTLTYVWYLPACAPLILMYYVVRILRGNRHASSP